MNLTFRVLCQCKGGGRRGSRVGAKSRLMFSIVFMAVSVSGDSQGRVGRVDTALRRRPSVAPKCGRSAGIWLARVLLAAAFQRSLGGAHIDLGRDIGIEARRDLRGRRLRGSRIIAEVQGIVVGVQACDRLQRDFDHVLAPGALQFGAPFVGGFCFVRFAKMTVPGAELRLQRDRVAQDGAECIQ